VFYPPVLERELVADLQRNFVASTGGRYHRRFDAKNDDGRAAGERRYLCEEN
jgi:hypothetical protein